MENPQAMRLKQAGLIENRRFVTQPTQQELDDALQASNGGGIGGMLQGLFGGKEKE